MGFLSDTLCLRFSRCLIPADSGWVLENTQAINAFGQITGQGFINGQYHAFVLRPMRVPR